MFTKFVNLPIEVQNKLRAKFVLPYDVSEVVVINTTKTPCDVIHGVKVACTVKTESLISEGFHDHSTRVNN